MSDGPPAHRPVATGPIVVALLVAAVIGLYWPTARDLLGMGSGTASAENYTHRILVVPIFFWLVWNIRAELAGLPVRIFWPGLVAVAAVGFAWLAGELAFIRLFTNLAVIAMLPFVVVTILGVRWLWALAFPLAFLVFAVPIRGPLVHLQVDLTARFSYMALLASGVPVHREGPYFELPTGKWAVADACSGVEYLSACLMMTALYAWTMYHSTRKRVIFFVGGAVVGIVGNWLRAYLTMFIAHLTNNRWLRDDHGTFGWYFFAALLFIYCLAGWFFRDSEAPPAPAERVGLGLAASSPGARIAAAVAAVFLILAAFPLAQRSLMQAPRTAIIEVDRVAADAGWRERSGSMLDWKPALVKPSGRREQSFEKGGMRVDLLIGVFRGESWTAKLVTSVNDFVDPESAGWSIVERGTREGLLNGTPQTVKAAALVGRGERVLGRQWYWVDGLVTGSDGAAKAAQLKRRVVGADPAGAWVAVYAPVSGTPAEAERALDDFMREMGPAIERALMTTSAR